MGLPAAVAEARALLAEARAALVQTAGEVARERARLARLTGLAVDDAALDPGWRPGWLPDADAVDPGRDVAGRADLRAAEERIVGAAARARLRRNAFLPDVDVEFLWYGKQASEVQEDVDWTVVLTGEWTVYDGGANAAARERERSAGRAAAFELRALRREAALEVRDAILAYRSIEALLPALEELVQAAAARERRARERLAAGAGTPLEVAEAERARLAAVMRLERTRYGRQLAALRLRLVLGRLYELIAERADPEEEPTDAPEP